MPTTDRQTTGFLEALAAWIAGRAGGGSVVIWEPGQGETRNLYIHHMPEDESNIISCLYLATPSQTNVSGIESIEVQIETRGVEAMNIEAAKERHELIVRAFLDSNFGDVPMRRFELGDQWFVYCADPQPVAQVDIDEKKRPNVKSTVKIRAALKPAA